MDFFIVQDYLGEHKYVFNVKNTYNREYFTAFHRFVYSNRPRHLPKPDILAYQVSMQRNCFFVA
jgi:hypothetical protein